MNLPELIMCTARLKPAQPVPHMIKSYPQSLKECFEKLDRKRCFYYEIFKTMIAEIMKTSIVENSSADNKKIITSLLEKGYSYPAESFPNIFYSQAAYQNFLHHVFPNAYDAFYAPAVWLSHKNCYCVKTI